MFHVPVSKSPPIVIPLNEAAPSFLRAALLFPLAVNCGWLESSVILKMKPPLAAMRPPITLGRVSATLAAINALSNPLR